MGNDRILEELYNAITSCDKELSVEIGTKAIDANLNPDEVIDTGVKAIFHVGREFEDGNIFIPELMLAGMALELVMNLAQKKILQNGGEVKKSRGRTGAYKGTA